MSGVQTCICGCGGVAVQLHHAVLAQEVRRAGGDLDDERNLVPVSMGCHAAHHNRSRPFALRDLPDSVYEYAEELLGPGPAFEALRRRYIGDDIRLEHLLRRHESV